MMRSTRPTRTIVALAGAGLVLAACGGTTDSDPAPEPGETEEETDEDQWDPQEPAEDEDNDESPTNGESPTDETPTDGDDETDTESQPDNGATGPADGQDTGPPVGTDAIPDEDLPGEHIETFFSEGGEMADVVGVDVDDVLFIRDTPGTDGEEIGSASPTDDVTLAGRERNLDPSLWAEIELDDGVGWVGSSYLGYIIDDGDDVTEEFAELGPESDPEALATEAAEMRTSSLGEDAGPELDWTIVAAQDEPVNYQFDILGMGDDSIMGERVDITLEEAAEGYEITDAQAFPICARGTDDAGLCM